MRTRIMYEAEWAKVPWNHGRSMDLTVYSLYDITIFLTEFGKWPNTGKEMWFRYVTRECIDLHCFHAKMSQQGNCPGLNRHVLKYKWSSVFHIMITLQFKYFRWGFVLQNWTSVIKEQIQILQGSYSKWLAAGSVIPICPSTFFKHYWPYLRFFFHFHLMWARKESVQILSTSVFYWNQGKNTWSEFGKIFCHWYKIHFLATLMKSIGITYYCVTVYCKTKWCLVGYRQFFHYVVNILIKKVM